MSHCLINRSPLSSEKFTSGRAIIHKPRDVESCTIPGLFFLDRKQGRHGKAST
jgi:hypothetical protein